MTSRKHKSGLLATFFVACWLLAIGNSLAQDITVGFYNLENLFDTIDHPDTFDEDFTPSSEYAYTTKRYTTKVQHLAKVVNEGYGPEGPSVIGFCEVENQAVLKDMVAHLQKAQELAIVHFESPDQRGIDNALVFNSKGFALINSGVKTVVLGQQERPTRDILWALLEDLQSGQEFIFYVNHWPSRYGGAEASEWKRLTASLSLIDVISSLRDTYPDALVVAMGDFNDHPRDQSVLALENCGGTKDACLVNMHRHMHGTDRGTHAYKGEWGVLDQILVDHQLLGDQLDFKVQPSSGDVISFDWMLYESDGGKKFPSRTYSGSRYYGGYSDHLPVVLTIERKK